jgi:hypothetical protein
MYACVDVKYVFMHRFIIFSGYFWSNCEFCKALNPCVETLPVHQQSLDWSKACVRNHGASTCWQCLLSPHGTSNASITTDIAQQKHASASSLLF